MPNNRKWNLWTHGPMPMAKQACPMFVKIILIAVYRHNSHKETNSPLQEKGTSLLQVFLPLLVTIFVWLVTCIPSVVTTTRNPLGTIIHIVFGITLACVYWTLVSAALAFSKNIGMLAAITAAAHFAWFCAPAHPDCIHGSKNIHYVMRVCIVVILYSTLARTPVLPHVPDSAFIITVWAPEIINIIVGVVFTTSTAIVLTWLDGQPDRPDSKDD
ncbi:hypothetical protein T484DRAFT_3650233 [Baffinella frigidus]|nr:hypothetical protein T484DRAFT_3650233 [Cryptophyta sp. CCMP2293]